MEYLEGMFDGVGDASQPQRTVLSAVAVYTVVFVLRSMLGGAGRRSLGCRLVLLHCFLDS
jgi:hypothetical protein